VVAELFRTAAQQKASGLFWESCLRRRALTTSKISNERLWCKFHDRSSLMVRKTILFMIFISSNPFSLWSQELKHRSDGSVRTPERCIERYRLAGEGRHPLSISNRTNCQGGPELRAGRGEACQGKGLPNRYCPGRKHQCLRLEDCSEDGHQRRVLGHTCLCSLEQDRQHGRCYLVPRADGHEEILYGPGSEVF